MIKRKLPGFPSCALDAIRAEVDGSDAEITLSQLESEVPFAAAEFKYAWSAGDYPLDEVAIPCGEEDLEESDIVPDLRVPGIGLDVSPMLRFPGKQLGIPLVVYHAHVGRR